MVLETVAIGHQSKSLAQNIVIIGNTAWSSISVSSGDSYINPPKYYAWRVYTPSMDINRADCRREFTTIENCVLHMLYNNPTLKLNSIPEDLWDGNGLVWKFCRLGEIPVVVEIDYVY